MGYSGGSAKQLSQGYGEHFHPELFAGAKQKQEKAVLFDVCGSTGTGFVHFSSPSYIFITFSLFL